MAKTAKALDIGSNNITAALKNKDGRIKIRQILHCFIEIDINPFIKNMLQEQKFQYVEMDKVVYILGRSAVELAETMSKEIFQPMKTGVINPDEIEEAPIFRFLLKTVLGKPAEPKETCFFSVPENIVDGDRNIAYHSGFISGALKSLGYVPKKINEGHAVVLSELADEDFTGIGISFGGGMVNVCIADESHPIISFSHSHAGDWIDENFANTLGLNQAKAKAIKEAGLNISQPKNKEDKELVNSYRECIQYTLKNIKLNIEQAEEKLKFSRPIHIVCSGGTALIKGFINIFNEELKKMELPTEINDVSLASEPLYATSKGCLLAALGNLDKTLAS